MRRTWPPACLPSRGPTLTSTLASRTRPSASARCGNPGAPSPLFTRGPRRARGHVLLACRRLCSVSRSRCCATRRWLQERKRTRKNVFFLPFFPSSFSLSCALCRSRSAARLFYAASARGAPPRPCRSTPQPARALRLFPLPPPGFSTLCVFVSVSFDLLSSLFTLHGSAQFPTPMVPPRRAAGHGKDRLRHGALQAGHLRRRAQGRKGDIKGLASNPLVFGRQRRPCPWRSRASSHGAFTTPPPSTSPGRHRSGACCRW